MPNTYLLVLWTSKLIENILLLPVLADSNLPIPLVLVDPDKTNYNRLVTETMYEHVLLATLQLANNKNAKTAIDWNKT